MNINVLKDNVLNKCCEIIKSPYKLAAILVSTILFFTFFIYKPAYNIADDFIMRTMADGTANPFMGVNNFLFYINSYYGEILKFLYGINKNVYWYDLCFYFLMSVSTFVSAFCILKKDHIKHNIISFITMFFIYLPLFISIQFTIVAGVLAISAIILSCYTILEKQSKKEFLLNTLGIIFFVIFSTLIRFHAFFAVALFGGILACIFVRKSNLKKILIVLLFCIIGVFGSFILYEKSQINMKNIPEEKECLDFNNAQVKLFNDTISANPFLLWVNPEKEVKDLPEILNKNGFTIGDYRLLLTWTYLGNDNIFETEKLNNLAKDLYPKIAIKHNFRIKFALEDYNNLLRSYLLIMICLTIFFISKKNIIVSVYVVLLFVLYIVGLNIPYRATPYRLWVNFASLMPVIYLLYLKYFSDNNIFKYDFWAKIKISKLSCKQTINILFIIMLIIYFIIGFRPTSKYVKFNSQLYKVQKIIKNELASIKDFPKVYIVNIHTLEHVSIPFKNNLYNHNLKILKFPLSHFPQEKNLLEHYNIPTKDTWDYICSSDNVEILTFVGGTYSDFYFDQIRLAVTKHMKDRYNKNIVFVKSQDFGHMKSYKCQVMTDDDLKLAEQIKKATEYNHLKEMEDITNAGFKY